MTVSEKHPLYDLFSEDWQQMSDTYDGERKVKEAGEAYLPATSGMHADGMLNENQPGYKAYIAYKKRAVYHDFVKDAINMMVDIMNRKPAQIKLPARMEPLREKITAEGHSLNTLLRQINFHQLLHSRFGLLVDVRTGEGPTALPYLATYAASKIINWDMGKREDNRSDLDMLVLDESELERTGFTWEMQDKFRVLLNGRSEMVELLGDKTIGSDAANFWAAPVRGRDGLLASAAAIQPTIAGKGLPYIPFTFINAGDLEASPEPPVLIGLSNLTLAIYRGEADYRQTLFMQGQDTLVIIGAVIADDEDDTRVGSGAKIEVPLGGDAKYIGVSADGLSEQRESLKADKEQAAERGARLLDFGDTARQSGDALRIRVAARTTTLRTLALTAGEGLQRSLRQIAEWIGADPEQVIVEPNLDFTDDAFTGQDVLEFMQAKAMGAPLSLKSIHDHFRKKDLTQKTFEDEMAEIEGERSLTMGTVLDPTKPEPGNENNPDNGRGNPEDPRQRTKRGTPGPSKETDN
jgi:hypothetical protein